MAGTVNAGSRARSLHSHKGAQHTATRVETRRVPGIDALRGVALLMMFVYHFAFDLRYFRVLDLDFENGAGWLAFRAIIVASFLTLVGISLVLAERNHVRFRKFMRRLGLIAAGALAATLASWLLFPTTFIYFGILHCIVVASLLAWPLRRQPWTALAIGAIVLIAGLAWTSTAFDARALSWIGFMTHKPSTEDYVPLAPWSAAVFVGIALGHALVRSGFRSLRALDGAPAWLRWLGRHSLAVYLLHQPVFIAVLWLLFGH